MAEKGVNRKTRKSNPMLTKTGKPRLGPLNIEQLTRLLDGARKKHRAKIQRAITKRTQTQTPVTV